MTTAPAPLQSGLKGLCPRCGAATLFGGFASFAPACGRCGLDYSAFNVGDGPAAFLTLIVGAVVTLLAILVELSFHPHFLVHVVLWVPLTAAAVIGALRVAKGVLLALEFRNAAREGRVSEQP